MACQVARESEVCMTALEVVVFLVLLLLLYWGLLWRARRRERKQRWHDDAWR
jgi:membrane protein DedA with SNARE-associated domain